MKLQIKCKICGKLCPTNQYLGLHLKQHNIKAKDYYDTYLKEIGDGYCIVCGKQTKFKTLEIGYNLHCGNSCGTKDKIVQTKKQNTNLAEHGNKKYNNRSKIEKTIKENWGENPWFLFSNKEWKEHCDELLQNTVIVRSEKEKNIINEKRKNTLNEKYTEEELKNIHKKQQKTMLIKYGGKTTMESQKLKNKVFKTKTKKYKNKFYNNPNKAKETLIKTKDITCGCQSVNENGIKKSIITNNKNFGCDYPQQNPEWYEQNNFGKYHYNNKCFDSSWELAFYIWLIDNKIRFEYHPKPITYYWTENGTYHKYYPDFKLWNNTLIEFKRPDLYQNMITYTGSKENSKYLCMVNNFVKIYTHCEKYEQYIKEKYGTGYLKQFKIK